MTVKVIVILHLLDLKVIILYDNDIRNYSEKKTYRSISYYVQTIIVLVKDEQYYAHLCYVKLYTENNDALTHLFFSCSY